MLLALNDFSASGGSSTPLAWLIRDVNRRDHAPTRFAHLYNWVTEGFDTADLIDAKALLDELRA